MHKYSLTVATQTPSSDLVFGDPAALDVSSSGDVGQSQFLELAFADEMPPAQPARAAPPKTQPKKRKQHTEMPLWDEKIELTEQELLQNREGYEERMKKERGAMLVKQRRFETANLVQSMMQGESLMLKRDGRLLLTLNDIPKLGPLLGGES